SPLQKVRTQAYLLGALFQAGPHAGGQPGAMLDVGAYLGGGPFRAEFPEAESDLTSQFALVLEGRLGWAQALTRAHSRLSFDFLLYYDLDLVFTSPVELSGTEDPDNDLGERTVSYGG